MQITLESKGYTVVIDSVGAELKSYRDPSGKEYIWTSDPAYWGSSSPLLFPIISNLREGKTTIKGKTFEMEKHGICRRADFKVNTTEKNIAEFSFRANEETLSRFPYDFTLFLIYSLDGNRLSMDYRVENNDTETMYYHLGAHPGFMLPISEEESIRDCEIEFEKAENPETFVYDLLNKEFNENLKTTRTFKGLSLPLDYSMFESDAVFFEKSNSKKISLLNSKTKKGVSVYFPDFESVAFWTPMGKEAPFLCVEPWNGCAIFHQDSDIFSEKRNILSLDPGLSKKYHLGIEIL